MNNGRWTSKAGLLLLLIILVSSIVFISNQSPESKSIAKIRWDGGRRIEQLNWWMNGRWLGQGEKGFEVLLQRIKELDDSASLKIYYPASLWNPTQADYQLYDPFPFQERDDLRRKFRAVFTQKYFLISEICEYETE